MRRYIKMAAVETKALGKLVDDVKAPADATAAMQQIKAVFEANGFAEAFGNLQAEVAGFLKG